jgi:hypothetical protein
MTVVNSGRGPVPGAADTAPGRAGGAARHA